MGATGRRGTPQINKLLADAAIGGGTEIAYELLIGRCYQKVFEGRIVIETDPEQQLPRSGFEEGVGFSCLH
jgi:hypothetical protein